MVKNHPSAMVYLSWTFQPIISSENISSQILYADITRPIHYYTDGCSLKTDFWSLIKVTAHNRVTFWCQLWHQTSKTFDKQPIAVGLRLSPYNIETTHPFRFNADGTVYSLDRGISWRPLIIHIPVYTLSYTWLSFPLRKYNK